MTSSIIYVFFYLLRIISIMGTSINVFHMEHFAIFLSIFCSTSGHFMLTKWGPWKMLTSMVSWNHFLEPNQLLNCFIHKTILDHQYNFFRWSGCNTTWKSDSRIFFQRSRHNKSSVIIFGQNYFKLPRHTGRENAEVLHIFEPRYREDETHIHMDLAGEDMSVQ